MMRISFLVFLAVFFIPLFTGGYSASAENPSVSSFSVSPTSFSSGYPASFSWTIQSAGGYSFIIPCVTGVTITYTSGAAFTCGVPFISLSKTSDSLTLQIHNVSGSEKTVTARITPKDGSGSDVPNGMKEVSMAVSTLADPITSFTSPSAQTESGIPITISWTSQTIGGTNLSIECKNDIKASSPSYTQEVFLPCGTPIFPYDLAINGSLTINFFNASPNALPYTITLLPAIEPRSYDGARSKSLTLSIGSDILPDPEVLSFSSSLGRVKSGGEFTLSWSTKNAAGANFTLPCYDHITATSSYDPKAKLPCGKNAFLKSMAAKGDLTFAFTNIANASFDVTISLVPERKDGKYDATRQKQVKITVEKAAVSELKTSQPPPSLPPPPAPAPSLKPPPPAPSPVPLPPSLPPPSTILQPPKKLKQESSPPAPAEKPAPPVFSDTRYPKITLTQTLKKGSRGSEVTALQEFLASDEMLAPEKAITGYFGSLTEHAVQRFQEKYGIASNEKNPEEYGIAGEKTRAKIHALGGTQIPFFEETLGEKTKESGNTFFTDEPEFEPDAPPISVGEEEKQDSGIIREVRSFFSYAVRLFVDFLTDYVRGTK